MKRRIRIGSAFGDYVQTNHQKAMTRESASHQTTHRQWVFGAAIFALLMLCFVRLGYLQIVKGEEFLLQSDTNRFKKIVLHAPRGIITDHTGIPLVMNMPGFRRENDDMSIPVSPQEAPSLMAAGIPLTIDSLRYYPYTDIFAHVVGYTGSITREELARSEFEGYGARDIVGKIGIERAYERRLAGIEGAQIVEMDAVGDISRVVGRTDPIAGEDIRTTLSVDIQKTAYTALREAGKGAVIVSTPDGAIRALISTPSFDANLFTMGKEYVATQSSQNSIVGILSDPRLPLFNRAISGMYPPGSTFKLLSAAAALEDKVIDAAFTVEDTGILRVGTFTFSNWYFTQEGKTDGIVDVVKAIARSNDIFFYTIGAMTGVDRISYHAGLMGVGRLTGIDIPSEVAGVLPTKDWKSRVIKDQWYLGDDYQYGIGQSYLLTTPLQVWQWTQALAYGGRIHPPYLVTPPPSEMIRDGGLSGSTIDLVRRGMIDSCRKDTGVAWPLYGMTVPLSERVRVDGKNFLEAESDANRAEIVIACKTGTAEHGDTKGPPHAWITLFAPAYDPQIVVTVFVEEGGQGSSTAGPIARKIIEEWYK